MCLRKVCPTWLIFWMLHVNIRLQDGSKMFLLQGCLQRCWFQILHWESLSWVFIVCWRMGIYHNFGTILNFAVLHCLPNCDPRTWSHKTILQLQRCEVVLPFSKIDWLGSAVRKFGRRSKKKQPTKISTAEMVFCSLHLAAHSPVDESLKPRMTSYEQLCSFRKKRKGINQHIQGRWFGKPIHFHKTCLKCISER